MPTIEINPKPMLAPITAWAGPLAVEAVEVDVEIGARSRVSDGERAVDDDDDDDDEDGRAGPVSCA